MVLRRRGGRFPFSAGKSKHDRLSVVGARPVSTSNACHGTHRTGDKHPPFVGDVIANVSNPNPRTTMSLYLFQHCLPWGSFQSGGVTRRGAGAAGMFLAIVGRSGPENRTHYGSPLV